MFMMGTVGVFVGGSLSDALGRSRAAALIFGISGLCSFAAGWLIDAPTWLIGLGFVYGFMTAADSAIYSTAVTELSPANRIGSTQAVQSFIGFAIGALVPVIAGSILDWAGAEQGWTLAFSFNGILAVIGLSALILLYRLPEAARMAGGKK
jgi:MFS family permease